VRDPALARNPDSAGLPDGVEVVRGDLADPGALDACLDGSMPFACPDPQVLTQVEQVHVIGEAIGRALRFDGTDAGQDHGERDYRNTGSYVPRMGGRPRRRLPLATHNGKQMIRTAHDIALLRLAAHCRARASPVPSPTARDVSRCRVGSGGGRSSAGAI
jgi:hypothetical protein